MQTPADTPLTTYLIAEQARFYRLAYSYLRQREDALDAVQSAVCRALERQDSLRDPELIRPWFYRILINTCIGCPAPPEQGGPAGGLGGDRKGGPAAAG